MNLEAMKKRFNELLKKLEEMRAKIATEDRSATDAELKLSGEILDEVDSLEAQIANEERALAALDRVKQPAASRTREPDGKTKPPENRTKRFGTLGEQLRAVQEAGSPDRIVDPRLITRAATGLNETTPSDGGFLVQTDFSTQLIKNIWDNGAVPSRITKIPISSNSNGLTIPGLDETSRADGSRSGGIRAYWAAEADEKTASKPKFREIELKLKKLIGLCYTTDELLQDAAALEAYVSMGFKDEFDFKISEAVINGTGAGQPLGIMNAGCMVQVNKETGQAANTIVYENIVKMWARLKASSRTNAVWLINQDTEPQLNTMSLAVGTGGAPVYLPAGGASSSPYSTLMGRPVIAIEQCQTLGTSGDIILADLSQYIGVDKGGIQQDVSIHVRFVYDESVFRFVYRFDGQPKLASAITPYKGTATQSHFVKLQTRS